MLRAALLALIALVALAVDPVDELTMAIRNGSPREALEKTQVWLRSHSANAKDTMTSMPLLSHAVAIRAPAGSHATQLTSLPCLYVWTGSSRPTSKTCTVPSSHAVAIRAPAGSHATE